VMTSSFTNMVIAANVLGLLHDVDRYQAIVEALGTAGDLLLGPHVPALAAVARRSYRTALFLGAGCRSGAAREGSLKLTEMSDGRVLSFAESYLGLRHGPMSAIREETLVVCFLSSDLPARAYEADLIREINRKHLGTRKVLIGEAVPADLAREEDVIVECPGMAALGDDRVPVLDAVVAQVLAFIHCLHLGLRPDSPSVAGVIHRVVEPFPIYGEAASGEAGRR
jgi:tagatose-6-phosphate ketose/aldose isomerase